MSKIQTAIVFGASGLVGSNLVKELVNNVDYNKVILIVRKPLVIVSPKIQEIQLDKFEDLDITEIQLSEAKVFCCLGTTIKKAGSKEEFKKVDYELPLKAAIWAKNSGFGTFIAISSIGANAQSGNFYLKTKGEMEESIKALAITRTVFVRPSLLMGTRDEFRLAEEIAKMFSGVMNVLLNGPLKKYRPIKASRVAKAMVILASTELADIIYESDKLELLADKTIAP
jgi:uncharacterized protein YbjT (DUF2867 family)